MKVIVAGGRDFFDEERMALELDALYEEGKLGESPQLVCGMAKGADLTAKSIFDNKGMKVHERPAKWKDMSPPCLKRYSSHGEYNALAGMKRNLEMANESDVLVAFFDGQSKGTKDMINTMRKKNKPVYVFNY